MNLQDLKKVISYKWRVQSFSKFKAQGQCVAYIDARQAQDLLDDVVGVGNWQDKYYSEGGLLFCSVGIKVDSEWVWKADTGSESNMEAQKGHSSDAFKRACVKWGIGRFLYNLKIQYVEANEIKTQKNYPYPVQNGKRIWDLTKHINSLGKTPQPETKITEAIVSQNEKLKADLVKAQIDVDLFYKVFQITDATLIRVIEVKNILIANWSLIVANGIKEQDIALFIKDTNIKLSQVKYDDLNKMCKDYIELNSK